MIYEYVDFMAKFDAPLKNPGTPKSFNGVPIYH